MPEHPHPKPHPHPARHGEAPAPSHPITSSGTFVELQVTSNYTFLTGASHPDELMQEAAALGYSALALTDCNTLGGIVRAHVAAQQAGIRLIVGCRLHLLADDRPLSILIYPTDLAAYSRLCRLLTLGKRRAPKGECHLTLHDLLDFNEGLLAVAIPPSAPHLIDDRFIEILQGLRSIFDADRLSLAAQRCYRQDDHARLQQLRTLASHLRIPLAATNDVLYHTPCRKPLQDVLTCIRHGCSIEQAGFRIDPNAERCLKAPQEMARLFARCPEALARTLQIADRTAAFSLDQIRYQYPHEVAPPGCTPMQHLAELTRLGVQQRYPHGIPEKVATQIRHELRLIEELEYAPYFLTVHDLVRFARSRGILCQGRGAAANSAVCYCLGITAVDPGRINLLFERFISRERNEPPDIDIDFEHQRREEVIQYIYRTYGRDRAALCAEVITYRGRSAVREVGKALGLSLDLVDRLAKNIDWWSDSVTRGTRLREEGLDPADPATQRLIALAEEIVGFPRHRSQHVGGFVITHGPLCDLVPIENARMEERTVIEWDKDDIDAMGMLKVDCLGLGMLTAIGKCFTLIEQHTGAHTSLDSIPPEDPAVYDMICRADTIGVFQIESRAQMQMLPRLRPRCYYDLVIEVAIVRPGPIQGDMVHPYLRRRNGEEPVEYPDQRIREVLGRTLGVPLFQEQAMALAVVAGGFTPGEADQLRRAIAAWKTREKIILTFGEKLVNGMVANGYPRDFADRCFAQLKGFSEYGFPESHAASFALIVYTSAWLKHYHPAATAAALINSQPMGFYAPAQIVRDAQEHGVEARPIDVNASRWECTLEQPDPGHIARTRPPFVASPIPQPALRLGMRLVKGLAQHEADAIADAVTDHGPFASIPALRRASGVSVNTLRRLASADAFGSMGLSRQQTLWQVSALRDEALPLFDQTEPVPRRSLPTPLPPIAPARTLAQDYDATGLSLKAHPLTFLRPYLDTLSVTPALDLADGARWPQGQRLTVAGLALVRQRPATASGIVFITLEDETATTNLIIRPKVFERYRRAARHGIILLAHGTIERQGEVIHILTTTLHCLDARYSDLAAKSRDFR